MNKRRAFQANTCVFLAVAIAATLLLSACTAMQSGPEPDTLRINLGAEPPSLDWHVATDFTSFDVVSNLMIGLTQYTPKLEAAPACAERWDVLDGGKRYVFHLRRGARWSDGKPLVAGDFEYAWKRFLDPQTAAPYAYFLYDIENAEQFATGKLKDASQVGVHALDDETLEVRLKRPAAYFIYLTALSPSYPMRRDVLQHWGERWTEPAHMVTNGPFKMQSWAHEYKIELARNDLFFEGPPKLKRIKMFMVPEQSTAFALYENNELDYIDNRSISTADIDRYQNSPEYHHFPLLRNNYIGFNVRKKPFDDRRVRLAFAMAIDRENLVSVIRRGVRPSYTWIPPGLAGYDPANGIKFDPARAKQLLQDAGYADGSKFPSVELLSPNGEDVMLSSEKIQDELKRNLGIHVDLINTELKVYFQTLHHDAPPFFRANWGADFPDPETFANLFTSWNGNNYTKWSDPKYDDLINRAEGEQDAQKRANLYSQADKYLCTVAAPISPTYLAAQNVMIKPWVHGIAMNPLDLQFFKTVWIDNKYKSR